MAFCRKSSIFFSYVYDRNHHDYLNDGGYLEKREVPQSNKTENGKENMIDYILKFKRTI